MSKFHVKAVFRTSDPDAAVSRIEDAIRVQFARRKDRVIDLSYQGASIDKVRVVVIFEADADGATRAQVYKLADDCLNEVMMLPEDMNPARDDLTVEYADLTVKPVRSEC